MLVTIIIFIAVLALIVLVHELGHFLVAKKQGVKVEEFGFGFPPRIVGFKKRGTLFSLNWIPLGGFVKLKGEQGENPNDEDSLLHKSIWRRATILIAGVAMNILLAIVLFSIGYSIGIPSSIPDETPRFAHIRNQGIQIVEIIKDSPAEKANLQIGDTIVSLGTTTPTSPKDIQTFVQSANEQPFLLTYERDDKTQKIEISAKKINENDNKPAIGVMTANVGTISYSFPYSIWVGIKESFSFLWLIISTFWNILVNAISHQPVAVDVVGPVGIAVLTGKVIDLGFMYLLQFVAIISLNLAIINVLPIPALDGGRLLFVIIEKFRGKPVDQRVEAIIHNVGFVILLLLIAFVTVRDVVNLNIIQGLF
jgi:regulator of sigma E protease